MTETEWFSGASSDQQQQAKPLILLDVLIAVLLGWALIMGAIDTAWRAWRRR